jgi:hypothetical protein
VTTDAQWADFLRDLTRERFTHLPETSGPVEGPQRSMLILEAAEEARLAGVVVPLVFPVARSEQTFIAGAM